MSQQKTIWNYALDVINNYRRIIDAGLVDKTTKRQRKNGTYSFYDPVAKVYYTLHDSGYVRRYHDVKSYYYHSRVGYPLNKRINFKKKFSADANHANEIRDVSITYSLVPDFEEQVSILLRAANNYRIGVSLEAIRRNIKKMESDPNYMRLAMKSVTDLYPPSSDVD